MSAGFCPSTGNTRFFHTTTIPILSSFRTGQGTKTRLQPYLNFLHLVKKGLKRVLLCALGSLCLSALLSNGKTKVKRILLPSLCFDIILSGLRILLQLNHSEMGAKSLSSMFMFMVLWLQYFDMVQQHSYFSVFPDTFL